MGELCCSTLHAWLYSGKTVGVLLANDMCCGMCAIITGEKGGHGPLPPCVKRRHLCAECVIYKLELQFSKSNKLKFQVVFQGVRGAWR